MCEDNWIERMVRQRRRGSDVDSVIELEIVPHIECRGCRDVPAIVSWPLALVGRISLPARRLDP